MAVGLLLLSRPVAIASGALYLPALVFAIILLFFSVKGVLQVHRMCFVEILVSQNPAGLCAGLCAVLTCHTAAFPWKLL